MKNNVIFKIAFYVALKMKTIAFNAKKIITYSKINVVQVVLKVFKLSVKDYI